MKITNIDREILHNFWTGKIWLMIILKVTKNQGFSSKNHRGEGEGGVNLSRRRLNVVQGFRDSRFSEFLLVILWQKTAVMAMVHKF